MWRWLLALKHTSYKVRYKLSQRAAPLHLIDGLKRLRLQPRLLSKIRWPRRLQTGRGDHRNQND